VLSSNVPLVDAPTERDIVPFALATRLTTVVASERVFELTLVRRYLRVADLSRIFHVLLDSVALTVPTPENGVNLVNDAVP